MLVIETESVIRGKLAAAGKMRIQCWLEGDVVCSRLEVAPEGYILGDVTARELYVEGQIVGNIEASIVHLMEGAFVEGDIRHSVLSIHPSASLLGKAVRTRGFASPELAALEARQSADLGLLEAEPRKDVKPAVPARPRGRTGLGFRLRAIAGDQDRGLAVGPAVDLGKPLR